MAKITKMLKVAAIPAPVVFQQGDIVSSGHPYYYMVVSMGMLDQMYNIVDLGRGKYWTDQNLKGFVRIDYPIQLENV